MGLFWQLYLVVGGGIALFACLLFVIVSGDMFTHDKDTPWYLKLLYDLGIVIGFWILLPLVVGALWLPLFVIMIIGRYAGWNLEL